MTGLDYNSPDMVPKLFGTYKEIIEANPDLTIMIGFEYFDLNKMREVAPDATAFPGRKSSCNAMIQVMFDGKAPNLKEIETKARGTTAALRKVASDFNDAPAYGNYGMVHCFDTFIFLLSGHLQRAVKIRQ